MKFMIISSVFVGFLALGSCLPEPVPPMQSGWGQPAAAQQQTQSQGWGQQAQPQMQGWGQAQQQSAQQQSGGWGQDTQQGSGWGGMEQQSNQKGKGGINWDVNFALGYQGDKGQKGGDGWGMQQMQQMQAGWGQPAAQQQNGGGGWSSEPETNVKKPNLGEIFKSIIGIPRELFNLLKESGLWILLLPLLVIIPLFLLAFRLGNFLGGMDEGWGWDKRSKTGKGFLEEEWDNLTGFLKDPKVQQAAKGFMDEFVAKRIMTSVSSSSPVADNEVKTKNKSS